MNFNLKRSNRLENLKNKSRGIIVNMEWESTPWKLVPIHFFDVMQQVFSHFDEKYDKHIPFYLEYPPISHNPLTFHLHSKIENPTIIKINYTPKKIIIEKTSNTDESPTETEIMNVVQYMIFRKENTFSFFTMPSEHYSVKEKNRPYEATSVKKGPKTVSTH